MIISLKVDLTNEEKDIFFKARDLADKLSDAIRNVASDISESSESENDAITEAYSRADLCDDAWQILSDLCDEFDIERIRE